LFGDAVKIRSESVNLWKQRASSFRQSASSWPELSSYYALVVLWLPSSATPKPILLRAFTALAVFIVTAIFGARRIQVFPVESILEKQPQDASALLRWRQGYLVTYCLSLSIALYGLVLHFLGFPTRQVAPFFVAGLALFLFFGPKAIPSNPAQSNR
jgi:hypothetical protein